MPNMFSLKSKSKSDAKSINGFDAFKKGFSTSDIDTIFKKYYNAAIDDILKHKASEAFNYTSQDNLVEYCVFVKLYDAEDQTVILFNKFSEFIEMEPSDTGYTTLKDTKLEKFTDAPTENLDGIERRNSLMTQIITNSLKNKSGLIENPRFQRLLLLLLIIRYYPLTVLSFIFENGKNIITSLKANTSIINDAKYTGQIQDIVEQIVPEPNLDDEATLAAVKAATQVATAAEARLASAKADAMNKLSASVINAKQQQADALAAIAEAETNIAKELEANDAAVAQAELEAQRERLETAQATIARETAAIQADPETQAAATAAANELAAAHDALRLANERLNAVRSDATRRKRGQPGPSILDMLGFSSSPSSSSSSSPSRAQSGGTRTSVSDTLSTISKAANKNNTDVSNLVKYSTNIFYKALTLLSLSIGFPINSNDTLIKDLVYNIKNYLTTELRADNLKPLIDAIAELIQKPDNYIIGTITKIDFIMEESRNPVAPVVQAVEAAPLVQAAPPAPGKKVKRPLNGKIAIEAAKNSVREIILRDLRGIAQTNALPVGKAIITKYAKKGIDEEYTREIGAAIVQLYQIYSKYNMESLNLAADIVAKNVIENIQYVDPADGKIRYDTGVEFYLKRGKELQMGGGRLDPDFNFENNLQKIIQKGIERSKFFISVGDSSSLIIRGGQRTQRNRNRSRNRSRSSGGTRKNMNSIEMDDYDDLI